jgi:hypothetical protein
VKVLRSLAESNGNLQKLASLAAVAIIIIVANGLCSAIRLALCSPKAQAAHSTGAIFFAVTVVHISRTLRH